MKPHYRAWLEQQKYVAATVNAQMYRTARVEEYYGNLDEHYVRDGLASVIEALRYSAADARRKRPNPTKIPIEGDVANNLASYRNAVERYRTFLQSGASASGEDERSVEASGSGGLSAEESPDRQFGLERDMQAALRLDLTQLEPGLRVADDGAERAVESGFIDITARDASGATVVIELKAGAAGQRAVAQLLSYMGDVSAEEEGGTVRGILVASSFDAKARAAARMVPNLLLRTYSVRFTFVDGSK